jgi:hypothetical protein
MSQPAIDLSRYHFARTVGDLAIWGTWLWNEDQEDTEPCLVILPAYRNGAKPIAIALSAAFKYNNPRYAVHACRAHCASLGFEDSMTKVHAIASLIFDHLGDLLSMPEDPQQAVVVGEASVDLGNGRKTTVELLDHEQIRD